MSVTRNPQQAEIAEKAEELLATLERLVPTRTIHYAVIEAERALRALARNAHTIKTTTVPASTPSSG